MHIGLVGLGKMGGNMRTRLRRAGLEVTGFDFNPEVRDVDSIEALVAALPAPRIVWIMVPHGKPTTDTVAALKQHLAEGDLVIEGGNSRFTDDTVNAASLAERGIGYLDCGVSGGVWGLDNGYGLMVGGDATRLTFTQPTKPVVISAAGEHDVSFRYLVLPVRLNS